MTKVREVNSVTELGQLRSVWETLLVRTPGADFFQSLDWLEVYWKHFGKDQHFRILEVSDDEGPLGILPLVVRPYRNRLGSFRVLTYPMDDWGSFYGPIGNDPDAVLYSGLRHVAHTRKDWDFVELRWMRPTGRLGATAASAMRAAGMPATERAENQIALVDLSTSWEQYWSERSGGWRSNCRRNGKKLAKQGKVRHVRYRPRGAGVGDGDARWDLYQECERIAHRSWQGNSTNGTTISHEMVRRFLRDVHAAAARSGCLDLNLLFVDDQAVAFNYNYVYRGHVSSLRLGFDLDFAPYGAGTVLTHHMLKDSFARGDHTFDFLPGSPQAKRPWQTTVQTSRRYQHLPWRFSRLELLRVKQWLAGRWGVALSS